MISVLRSTIDPHRELSDRELVDAHARSVVVGAGTVTMEIYENSMAVGGLGSTDLAQSDDDEGRRSGAARATALDRLGSTPGQASEEPA